MFLLRDLDENSFSFPIDAAAEMRNVRGCEASGSTHLHQRIYLLGWGIAWGTLAATLLDLPESDGTGPADPMEWPLQFRAEGI
jgi:hypothetical protein